MPSFVPDLVKEFNALKSGLLGDLLVRLSGSQVVLDVVGTCTSKDDEIQQRVSSKAVGSMDGDTGGLAGSVETRNNLVLAILVDSQNLSGVLGRNTTH